LIRYAITDPAYYTDNPGNFKRYAKEVLVRHKPDWIVLRDKKTQDYPELAYAFLSLKNCFPHIGFFLHTDLKLAHSLRAQGIHLASDQIADVALAKKMGLYTIVSTHTLQEAFRAERIGADAVTFSPVFESPGKGKPAGLEKLKEIRDKISIKVIALGGIVDDEQIRAVAKTGIDGYASIRRFVL